MMRFTSTLLVLRSASFYRFQFGTLTYLDTSKYMYEYTWLNLLLCTSTLYTCSTALPLPFIGRSPADPTKFLLYSYRSDPLRCRLCTDLCVAESAACPRTCVTNVCARHLNCHRDRRISSTLLIAHIFIGHHPCTRCGRQVEGAQHPALLDQRCSQVDDLSLEVRYPKSRCSVG